MRVMNALRHMMLSLWKVYLRLNENNEREPPIKVSVSITFVSMKSTSHMHIIDHVVDSRTSHVD